MRRRRSPRRRGGLPCHRARPPRRHGGPRRAGEAQRRASCRWGREPSHRSRQSLELGSHVVREGLHTTETGRHATGRATLSRGGTTGKKGDVASYSPAGLGKRCRTDGSLGIASVARCRAGWARGGRGAPPGDWLAGGPRDGEGHRRGEGGTSVCRVIRGRRETKRKIGRHFCWPNRSR